MSITLITGVPGSGKTLYCVSNFLKGYIGQTIPVEDDDGVVTMHPRTIYSNINGLLLEHELIEGVGSWQCVSKQWEFDGPHEYGLRNWHEWAKPGSIIVYDEFQKVWPPRPNGSGVPPDIQTLDTHRHMGVDFILLTQNCMNVDRHILGLVDRHLHIRRVANLPMAVVYEWDHASKSLLFKNSLTKSPWRYDKSVYKLYKSARVHTKQKRKLPGLVWFVLAGLAGAAYAVPTLKNRITERVTGKPAESTSSGVPDQPKPGQKMEYSKDGIKYTVETTSTPAVALPATVPASGVPLVAPVVAGCIATPKKCACTDSEGVTLKLEPGFCEAHILGNAVPGAKLQASAIFDNVQEFAAEAKNLDRNFQDAEVLAFMLKARNSH